VNILNWLQDKKIGVLYGGTSSERSISLLTGNAVLRSLKRQGFKAAGIDTGKDIFSKLKKEKIDFAYIALHGPLGEDGTVQGALEILGVPYSGCGVLSSAACMNKIFAKKIMRFHRVPTPDWIVARKNGKVPKTGTFPVVVKPAAQGSAIGVSICRRRHELSSALKKAFKFDKHVLIEQYIKGIEITVGVLGNTVLPAVEIVPEGEFYDFRSKYKPGMSKHIIPPRLPQSTLDKCSRYALEAFKALECRGVARVDIMVDSKLRPWVLEVNTIPGMTETSLLPDEAKAIGMSFDELVLGIIENSVCDVYS
jgi:D-alanine-D-alanine ligase